MATASKPLVKTGRSTVYGKGGMVCSISPLAASAGIRVLQEGGNAFDAAVAVGATEAVTVPAACGLGGEPFVLMYEARTGKMTGLSGSGRAPRAASREFFVDKGYKTMPLRGPHSAAIPGEVDAYVGILERYGTMSLERLLEPAIGYAEEGYVVSRRQARGFKALLDVLSEYPDTAAIFTKNGRPIEEGDVVVNKNLAKTLRRVAKGGAEEFYRGDTAKEIIRAWQAAGGLYTEEELAEHSTDWYDVPISTTYRGHEIYATNPPSQGFLVLEILNILEGYDLAGMGFNTADSVHVMVEALKLAFKDRNAYMKDPRFGQIPLDDLISKEFAERRRQSIDTSSAAVVVNPGPLGAPVAGDSNTSYFCVMDSEGNALSYIHSLSAGYGSGFVAGSTGVLLNNRSGRGFSLVEGHPNVIEPGKRTMHTLNAYMTLKDGKPNIVGGTPGGDRQIPWNVQVLTNIIDHGMDPQQAVEAQRWVSWPGTDPAHVDEPYRLELDPGMPAEEAAELEARGHRVVINPEVEMGGSAKVIMLDADTGVQMGGSDPRSDGHAVSI